MELINFVNKRDDFISKAKKQSVLISGNEYFTADTKITICIPTYKRAELLREALESALSQKTEIPYLVIVVDNEPVFSETETSLLLKQYSDKRLLYYKNAENLGMMGNWNRCGLLVKTEYFSFLHDDDILMPNFIETIAHSIKQNDKIDSFVCSFMQQNKPHNAEFGKKNFLKEFISRLFSRISGTTVCLPLAANLFNDNIYGPPTCGLTFKRSSFLASGGYNPEYWPTDDWIFMIYFSSHNRVRKIKKNLAIYRWISNESLNASTLRLFKEHRKLIILSLARYSIFCSVLFYIFRKDFTNRMESPLEKTAPMGFIFSIIQQYYSMRLK